MKLRYPIIEKHIRTIITHGTDQYGQIHTPMFVATLDPETKRYPEDDTRPDTFKQRAYRLIHAPRGSSAYWDQPLLAAMYTLAKLQNDDSLAAAADNYLAYFMDHCTSTSGVFLWGNHYFYQVFDDQNVQFLPLKKMDLAQDPDRHEMRPIIPNWIEMYRVNPRRVSQHIRHIAKRHLFDAESGGFNRHSDERAECAFLESGGILVQSICFLYGMEGDEELLKQAMAIAQYSYFHRNETTGLLINNPTKDRWDGHVTTTEVGLWAQTLANAAGILRAQKPNDVFASACADELRRMAISSVKAYLSFGYDHQTANYWGQLNLDGTPFTGERKTPYMPGLYSDIWEYLFPTHDYPMAMAMFALRHRQTDPIFAEGARRWADIAVRDSKNHPDHQVRYAEHYGRNIAYLAYYASISDDSRYRQAALHLAEEAIHLLTKNEMLVGHTGAQWYDAIDGVGYLLLALLYLESEDEKGLDFF